MSHFRIKTQTCCFFFKLPPLETFSADSASTRWMTTRRGYLRRCYTHTHTHAPTANQNQDRPAAPPAPLSPPSETTSIFCGCATLFAAGDTFLSGRQPITAQQLVLGGLGNTVVPPPWEAVAAATWALGSCDVASLQWTLNTESESSLQF